MADVRGHQGQIFNAKLNTRGFFFFYKPLSNCIIYIAKSFKSNAGKRWQLCSLFPVIDHCNIYLP